MIYLDYNATTPIAKEVAEAMLPYIYNDFGNPSSSHRLGINAKKAVDESREKIAELLNCLVSEIVFTSGGSESNNMVIKGVAHTYRKKGDHIITSQIEHPSILNPCKYLESIGYKISYLPVDKYGVVEISKLEKLITNRTILVTIMHANNETGVIQPIEEISEICKKYKILLHTDAAQSMGKIDVDVEKLGVDFLTIAGHKLYAPKGIGAVYIKKGIAIEPLIHGAGHETGKRAGTENIMFDVALGKACEAAKESLKDTSVKLLTDYFYSEIKKIFKDRIKLNGHPEKKLPNTLNISFLDYLNSEILVKLGNDIAVSTGSACHSGLISISPVLKAMGTEPEIARGAVRFSLGKYTNKEEIDVVLGILKNIK